MFLLGSGGRSQPTATAFRRASTVQSLNYPGEVAILAKRDQGSEPVVAQIGGHPVSGRQCHAGPYVAAQVYQRGAQKQPGPSQKGSPHPYYAIVAAMSRNLEALSRDIVDAISRLKAK
jgi:hypothetical protein